MFAVASRWSNDERVLPMNIAQGEEDLAWRLAGERYFDVCMGKYALSVLLFLSKRVIIILFQKFTAPDGVFSTQQVCLKFKL